MSRTLSIKLCAAVLGCILAVVVIGGHPAHAQQQEDTSLRIGLQPAILDVSGQAGSSTTTTITVFNPLPEPVGVVATSRSLAPEDIIIDDDARANYDATQWVTFPKQELLIEGRSSVDVDIAIDVPISTVPGGRYALASFRIVDDSRVEQSGVRINKEAAAVMLITVPGEVVEQLELVEYPVRGAVFGTQIEASYDIVNIGNTHTIPIIQTEILNSDGMVIDTIKQSPRILLPNTRRPFTVAWTPDSTFGAYSIRTNVSYGTVGQTLRSSERAFRAYPSGIAVCVWVFGTTILIAWVWRRMSFKYAYSKRPSGAINTPAPQRQKRLKSNRKRDTVERKRKKTNK